MLYFIQLTPWSTMKHVYRGQHSNTVKQKHEHWGLLPTWDLDCTANIVAWNKLRIFLQAYEVRSSRRVQISVVYLLLAWLVACVYQAVKAYLRRGDEVLDIETIFVISSTVMLAVGLSAILFTGKWINDITQIGFPHVLRVKQAELLDKTSHYLVEYDFWNGTYVHSDDKATTRHCAHHDHHYSGRDLNFNDSATRDLKVSQLRKRAELIFGKNSKEVDEALDSQNPKDALIHLLRTTQAVQATQKSDFERELGQKSRSALEKIAEKENVPRGLIDDAGDATDPDAAKQAIVKLIVDHRVPHGHHPVYDQADHDLLLDIEERAMGRLVQRAEIDKGPRPSMSVSAKGNGVSMGAMAPPPPSASGNPHQLASLRREELTASPAARSWLMTRMQTASTRQISGTAASTRQISGTADGLGELERAEMATHCYRLLETLIQTVDNEYRIGSRSHWGAEDRRTKLWFIVMGQNTIKGFAAALLSGISPIIIHIIDKLDVSP